MAGPSAALRLDRPAVTPTGIPAAPASAAGDLPRDLRQTDRQPEELLFTQG